MTTGALVLWIDARNAAEMGSRPLITTDDLEDFPALRDWLHQPLDGTWRFRHLGAIMASHLNANQVRILREYAATFARRELVRCPVAVESDHVAIRRNDLAALAALPQLWTEVTAFGLRLDVELERALPSIVECMQGQVGDATEEYNTRLYLNNLVQVTGSNCYIALSIYELLQRAVARTGQVDYLWPLLDALAHAKTQLKRVARLVKVCRSLRSVGCADVSRLFRCWARARRYGSIWSGCKSPPTSRSRADLRQICQPRGHAELDAASERLGCRQGREFD